MFKKLSLFQRLILANVLYALPVISLIYLMVEAQNVNIDFARQETKGNAIQRPLENLLQALLEARVESPTTGGAEKLTKITQTIHALETPMNDLGEDLQFTEEGLKKRGREAVKFESFLERWSKFSEKAEKLGPSAWVDGLNSFIADVRTMITHAGDTSNLILDPDLDSYYLMDVTLLALPQSQDRIAEIMAFVRAKYAVLSAEDRIQLAVYAALVKQADLDRVIADLQTTLNEDPQFYGESPTLKSHLSPAIAAYQASVEKFMQGLSALAAGEAGKTPSYDELLKSGGRALEQSFVAWNVAVGELDVLLDKRLENLTHQKHKSLLTALAALGVAVLILFWISSSFNRNMTVVISQLRDLVSKAHDSGDDLVTTSQSLSTSSIEQAEALQQTSAAMEQIRSMVQATVASATEAKGSAENSLGQAEAGQSAVKKLIRAIQEISDSNKQVLQQMVRNKDEMSEITHIIAEISGKTKVINDIVFQTKLLSFNASVEAARAGEAGKGFAVVAEEVGNLAQMSGGASNEISDMLNSSVKRVEGITNETHSRVEGMMGMTQSHVSSGVQLANECTSAIDSVLAKFQDVLRSTESIHQAAVEQAKGIEEVNKAVQKLETVSQKNSVVSQRTADQSQEIADQARKLDSIAAMIQREIMGSKGELEKSESEPNAPVIPISAKAESSFSGERVA